MDSSLSLRPAIQLAGLILSGLFFLNQTRKQGLVLSLLCMLAWLGAVFLALGIIRQQQGQVSGSISISKRVEIIDEIELIQLDPIIQTETEQVVVVLPNEDPSPAQIASWANVPANVARWQPYIMKSIAHCGLTIPGYDPALLMAAIVTQESSGNPNAMGDAHDTGLAQVVNRSHRLFPNRPSREELLDPQFNLNFASCLLKDNLNYTANVEAAVNAYNGNGIHNGRTYAQIIFGHYRNFVKDVPVLSTVEEVEKGELLFASWPVSGTPRITQNYHSAHPGFDVVGSGQILAVMDGVVQYVGPLYQSANNHEQCAKAGCLGGFSVVLNHGGGTFTIYGHNSCSYVKAGESVRAGQPIACMGSEGRSTGPHLHFELRKNETWNGNPNWPWRGSYLSAANPTSYLP